MYLGEVESKSETDINGLSEKSYVIGILVSKSNRKLKRSLNHLKDLGDLIKNGQIGAFSLKGVNRNKKIIKGYLYREGIWKRSTFLMPDAVINRISLNSKWESFFRATLGRRMLNNYTFNKWEMYESLSKNPNLSMHLPITRLVKSPKDIIEFIEEYNEVFIKPISGSYGKAIFKVSKQEEKFKVEASYQKSKESLYLNQEELEKYFTLKCKKRKYIIQQVIDLYVGNSPIDFRLIMIKDGEEEWRDLGLIARKGRKNEIISNNGSVKSGNSSLQNLLAIPRNEAIKLREEMTRISLDAAKEMENFGGYNGNLGNLGIDLGIDKKRNIWIIEMNHRNPRHLMAVDAGEDSVYFYSNQLIIENLLTLLKRGCSDDVYKMDNNQ